MTKEQKIKILTRIVQLESDIEAIKKARNEIGICGYASASLSSTGGSKSYTRIDLDKLQSLLNSLLDELKQYRNLLRGGESKQIKTIATIYS